MSVDIDPQELGFHRPFTVEVVQILKIKNPSTSPVAFKVKTTAPKQYCVRPNSGRIEPGHEVEVSVLLQAMKQEPAPDARCRDKFLVQSVTITGDKEFANVQQIWDSVEKSAIQEKKIRVLWLAAVEDGHIAAVSTPVRRSLANGVESTPDAPPPAYSSPNEESNAPISEPDTTSDSKQKMKESEADQSILAAAKDATVATASTVQAAATETLEQLKEQLAKAQATIAALKEEATSGLRQRKPDSSAASTKSTASAPAAAQAQATRQTTEGVSVKVTAILCLFSFLLAYFFF
ncbi:PapD-like protein [Podospora appendiculata]|uniref:PapD-like protein n=1 Tax=Podospora appendiculata TaxID=314037 RepID=A0AAE0WZE6_9PEZI|nr:PapD-like protein [Podospora appendiculata]KAK3681441.1 PapD-like protein [Podospora appendiculata]